MLYLPRPKLIWQFNITQAASDDIEEIKAKAFRDFGFFIRHFFPGHFWGEFSPVHKQFIDLEKNPDRRGSREVIAAPRGNAKTVFRVICKVIHSIVYGYHPFTVIIGYSSGEAEGKVKDILSELRANDELIRVFGKLVKSGGVKSFETKNGCMVVGRGRGGQIRGLRFGKYRPTHIICDDVEDLEGVQSQLQRDKTMNWLKKDVLAAGQSGEEYKLCVSFVGTVLHDDSLLAHLLKDPFWHFRQKYKSVLEWSPRQDLWDEWRALFCNLDDEKAKDTAEAFFNSRKSEMLAGTQVLWPDGEPYYELMNQLIGLGTAAFFSEKQNEPFDPDRQILNPDICVKFKVYTPDSPEWLPELGTEGFAIVRADNGKAIHSRDLNVIAFYDPAVGRKNKNGVATGDYAAIVVCAQDLSGYIYCLDAWLKKAKPDVQVRNLFALAQKWDIGITYLEEVGFQELLKGPIADEQKKWERALRVIGVGQHSDKVARITSIQPYFENQWLLLAEKLDPEFIQQIRLFPTVHDDGPDALEGCIRRLKKPRGYIGVQESKNAV